jgi:hypothetical protein
MVVLLLLLDGALADGTCDSWSDAREIGPLEEEGLVEASGMAPSWSGDVLWVNNDAGDGPVLYAIGTDGAALGGVVVEGATHTDWEDLASGPCGAACSCLYVADIGNNDGTRTEGVVWRIPEPSLEDTRSQPAEALRYVFPDGPQDSEAMLVDPVTGEIFLLTRTIGTTRVYGFPDAPAQPTDAPVTLELVATLDLTELGNDGEVVGGSVSRGGARVALRTNGDLLLFQAPDGGGVRQALETAYTRLPTPEVPDPEAMSWSYDGSRIYLANEGLGTSLWEVACADFVEGDAPERCPAPEPIGGCGCGGSGASGVLLPLLGLLRRQARGRRR